MFVPILAYHMVQPGFDFGITNVTPGQFESQMKYLSESGYKSVAICDFIGDDALPRHKQVVITFDDAYGSVFEFAFPILERYGFTATVFVISNFIGQLNHWDYHLFRRKLRHCDAKQLQTLASEGWEIGSHCVTHRDLTTLGPEEVKAELKHSKDTIEDTLQTPVRIVSYPFGKFNQDVLNIARQSGYAGGCTLGANFPQTQTFPLALFRRGVYLIDPFWLFKKKLENSCVSRLDDWKQRLITNCSRGTSIYLHMRNRLKKA